MVSNHEGSVAAGNKLSDSCPACHQVGVKSEKRFPCVEIPTEMAASAHIFLNPNPLFQCFCFCIPKFLLCCNSKRLPQLEQGPPTQDPGLEGTRSWRISDLKDRSLSSLEQKAAFLFPHSSGIFLHKSQLTVGDKR